MLLHLDEISEPMKMVYKLSEELENDHERVKLTQALTLDASKPSAGLKGVFGLFGSQEWWRNIEEKAIPLLYISGIIQRVYLAGQDASDLNNTIDLLLSDGSIRS